MSGAAVSVECMASVVFIQGGGAGAYAEDERLVASLRRELGPGIPVAFPPMPVEDEPDPERWGPVIAAAIAVAAPPVVLVGHSIGGYLLLTQLAAEPPDAAVAAICLLAVPFPGGDSDWTFEGFELPDNLAGLPAPVFLYASEDDDVVPFAHRDLYAAAIPGSVVRTTTGGHQLGENLHAVADDIRAAVTPA